MVFFPCFYVSGSLSACKDKDLVNVIAYSNSVKHSREEASNKAANTNILARCQLVHCHSSLNHHQSWKSGVSNHVRHWYKCWVLITCSSVILVIYYFLFYYLLSCLLHRHNINQMLHVVYDLLILFYCFGEVSFLTGENYNFLMIVYF